MSSAVADTKARLLGTPAPRGAAARERLRELVDRFVGFDPGLTQLLRASHAISALALAALLGYAFEHLTSAMQLKSGPPEVLAAQHHGALIVAMLLPAIVAMLDSTGVNDGTIPGRLVSSLGSLAVFFGAMALGLVIAQHRLPLLIWLVVAPMVAVYIRRFPSRGFVFGVALFNGAFLAYFMHTEIALHDLGWVAAEVSLGTLASVGLRLLVFRPDNRRSLVRMQRAWIARSHTVIDLAWQLATEPAGRRQDRLDDAIGRQLVRLNESSLMIDAQLAQPEASAGSASVLHQRLFDQELALSNIARFTEALVKQPDARIVTSGLQNTLAALKDEDLTVAVRLARKLRDDPQLVERTDTLTVLVHRFAGSVTDLAEAQREWLDAGAADSGANFVPAVQLMSGFLPGSGPLSEKAGHLKPYQRSTLQIGVAATIAVVVGDLVDSQRLYWALLATFLAFMATSNTGEQVLKACYRLFGTAFGILIGDGLVHLADRNLVVSLVIIVVALFVGFYLVRVNYMFLVVGITVTMSQLYVQLNEFSWHLLLLRLAETAVGVGAVVVAVVLVVPLSGSRVVNAGFSTYLGTLQDLVGYCLSTISRLPAGYEARPPSRLDVRKLDGAYQNLLTVATPLRVGMFGHRATRLNEGLAIASASRYYVRNLAAGVEYSDLEGSAQLDHAAAQLLASMAALRAEPGEVRGPYVRSAALFESAARAQSRGRPNTVGSAQLVVRDLMLLDGALARLAKNRGMAVIDTDTEANAVQSS